ncbi:unnamed protein product [Paramecium octaurelia]|uniref:Transmembrane protein n=1 Tax=Paramecium octaurelia TaxID=43137 RepID=A0A8S1TSF8_PAROT|nr:unnamed protein product [Paramecium octaurelia]
MKEAANISDEKRPLASIPLQTFLYFDYIFTYIYFIIEIIVFIYKGYGLFYPPNKIGIEIFLQFLLAFCQFPRLILGSIGNKTESPSQILWFVLLIFPCIFFYIFFIVLQTYVVILEIIINVIALIFIVFELLFSLSAFLTFKNYEKQQ